MKARVICFVIAFVIISFIVGTLISDHLPWNQKEEILEETVKEVEFFLDGVKISEEDLQRRIAQEFVGPHPFYRTDGKILTGQAIKSLDADLVRIIFNKIVDLHSDIYLADLNNLSEREILEFVTIRKGTYRINMYFEYGRAKEGAGWAKQDEIALSLHGKPVLLLRCLNPVKLSNPPAAKKVVEEFAPPKIIYVPTYDGGGGNGGGNGETGCGPGSPSNVD